MNLRQKNLSVTQPLPINAIAFGGEGIAHHEDGKVIFCEGAIPGDMGVIQITAQEKSFDRGLMMQITEPSPDRISPPCEYAAACGGCQWQYASYSAQQRYKTQFIKDALTRIGKFPASITDQVTFAKTEESTGYRQRVLLRGTIDDTGAVRVGFFQKNSHTQVPIARCIMATSAINDLIHALNHLTLPTLAQKFRLHVTSTPESASDKRLICVLEAADAKKPHDLRPLLSWLKAHPLILWADYDKAKKPLIPFTQTPYGVRYTMPGNFEQAHASANQQVIAHIQKQVSSWAPKVCADLYCGSGNLTTALIHESIQKIDGVESVKSAITCAEASFRAHAHLFGLRFFAEDVLTFLKKQLQSAPSGTKHIYDAILLDPPRVGCEPVMKLITEEPLFQPRYLIYLSCNPATLARDLAHTKDRYHITEIMGYDFFPFTYHVETLVFLERKD